MTPNRFTRPRARLTMCVAALAVSALTATPAMGTFAPAVAEVEADGGKAPAEISGLRKGSTERVSVFVQLDAESAASVAAFEPRLVEDQVSAIEDMQRSVVEDAKQLAGDTQELYTMTNLMPGVALRMEEGKAIELAKSAGVKKVWRIHAKERTNGSAAELVHAINTWKYKGYTGKGVKVGVIDTGLDYTHATFGGVGTVEAYKAAQAKETDPNWRDGLPDLAKAKILGGYDFAGDAYTGKNAPAPDSNPLDCQGHGSHVGGTVGGYGVTADGKTFTGDYSKLSGKDTAAMLVGPGMAPNTQLYGLRIFGCEGSSELAAKAIEWAMDPNGDRKFDDRLDIINMSIGSPFGAEDDFEVPLINEAAKHGLLAVVSAGNSGDVVDAAGPPGSAAAALTVASSRDALQPLDGLKVDAPENLKGQVTGQVSRSYDWDNAKPVSGKVVAMTDPTNLEGCNDFSAADAAAVKGNIVWLEWDDNGFTRPCGSGARAQKAVNAGAIGALFSNNVAVFSGGIAGSAKIPVLQLTQQNSDRLRAAAKAGTLQVTFDPALRGVIKDADPALADTLSTFTSRGGHGSNGVSKPDVSAPGDTIISAAVGTGNQPTTMSGTSMAAPTTAGVAALLKEARPAWSALQLKAAMMNGTTTDLFSGLNRTGPRFGPLRAGAGRVDAVRTLDNRILMYADAPDNLVSASFGVVDIPADQKEVRITKNIVLENTTGVPRAMQISTDLVTQQGGVRFEVPKGRVFVRSGGKATFPVTMVVDVAQLRRKIDPTMDVKQADVFRQYVADTSGKLLAASPGEAPIRIPLFAAPRPVSKTTAVLKDSKLTVEGTGFKLGEGREGWESLMTAVELGGESPKLPVCTEGPKEGCTYSEWARAADLKSWGAAANDKHTWFAITTHSNWRNPGNAVIPAVEIDTNNDGQTDFEMIAKMRSGSNIYEVTTINVATKEKRVMPANFREGDKDTGVFDNNIAILPVANDMLGVTAGTSKTIKYRVSMVTEFSETGEWTEFDAGTPKFTMAEPLVADRAGTEVAINPKGDFTLMALHLHGDADHKVNLIKVAK